MERIEKYMVDKAEQWPNIFDGSKFDLIQNTVFQYCATETSRT